MGMDTRLNGWKERAASVFDAAMDLDRRSPSIDASMIQAAFDTED